MTAVWRDPVQAALYIPRWVMCAHLAGGRGPRGPPPLCGIALGEPPKGVQASRQLSMASTSGTAHL